jgi:hypothetical protein
MYICVNYLMSRAYVSDHLHLEVEAEVRYVSELALVETEPCQLV